MTSPAPGSTLPGSSVTFAWTAGSGVTEYWLHVGSTPGGSDLYNRTQGSTLSGTVTGLPTDGRPLYVRLWSLIGAWQWIDYVYTAASSP
jgi:serine protease